MALWTDVIDPVTLTGYARAALADYEERRGTLARWLPNRYISDIVARFVKGQTGLLDAALFRAYDAEPEFGRRPVGKRVTIELPALGQNLPVTEYEQLRLRSGDVPPEAALVTMQTAVATAVRAIADAIERMRGIVLATGKATINQTNFIVEDDFGRPAGHTTTAGTLWTLAATSRLDYLTSLTDIYTDATGEAPGALLMSTRVFRSLAAGNEFSVPLVGGSTRPPNRDQVNDVLSGASLPPVTIYDRRVSVNGVSTRVIADDRLLLLPEAVDTEDWAGTDLGATFWGRTLTSTEAGWNIPDADQPGVVAGIWRNEKPPMGVECISDAIGLPVLANAERSICAKVL